MACYTCFWSFFHYILSIVRHMAAQAAISRSTLYSKPTHCRLHSCRIFHPFKLQSNTTKTQTQRVYLFLCYQFIAAHTCTSQFSHCHLCSAKWHCVTIIAVALCWGWDVMIFVCCVAFLFHCLKIDVIVVFVLKLFKCLNADGDSTECAECNVVFMRCFPVQQQHFVFL